jgi:integrase/recombinase XerD
MTPLRQRMIEDMQLRGLAPRTQEAYVGAVKQLAEYYHKSPDLITDEELRQYFLYLKNDKHASRSTYTHALYGIRFLFQYTLKRPEVALDWVRPPKEKKLPVVLSVEEVKRILDCLHCLHYRACLSTIYSCGLRLQEGVHLQVQDIDSARMMLHVRQGKGNKDRYVPLPQNTLELLRQWWSIHQHPVWIFPAHGGHRGRARLSVGPPRERGTKTRHRSHLAP